MVESLMICWLIQLVITTWLNAQWISRPHFSSKTFPQLSIVVCARNEANRIRKCIEHLLKQNYPSEFDIILIDHASTDSTLAIMKEVADKHPILTVYHYPDTFPSKKRALKFGVEKANSDWVAVTDADCLVTQDWLRYMSFGMNQNTDVVLGMGVLLPISDFKLWQRLVCWETWLTAFTYGGKALAGQAYMGVGRNMAFRKEVYLSQDWKIQDGFLSGDDDIFISQFQDKQKIAVQMHPWSVSESPVQPTISQWIQQRHRHISTSAAYDRQTKAFLAIGPFSHIAFFIIGVCSLFSYPYVFPSLLLLRWAMFYWIQQTITRKELMPRPIKSWIIADLFMPLYYGLVGILLTKKADRW